MPKLLVIPNDLDIDEYMDDSDAFLFGMDQLSVQFPCYIHEDQLEHYTKKIKKNHKKIFISMNKNIQNDDLTRLEDLLIYCNTLKIDGIFYYDVSVLNIVRRLKLSISLIWSAEHLTTNYATIEFFKKYGVEYTYLSGEITFDEIQEISKKTDCKLIVPIFGYLPIFTSKRHAVNNYLEYFQLKNDSKINYMRLKNDDYPIVDNEMGTSIFSSNILNGYQEYLQMDHIEYVTLNAFGIPKKSFLEILRMYALKNSSNEEKINQMFSNIDKGFLHKETIYRVKKHD